MKGYKKIKNYKIDTLVIKYHMPAQLLAKELIKKILIVTSIITTLACLTVFNSNDFRLYQVNNAMVQACSISDNICD